MTGWAATARSAFHAGLERPRLWPFALAAFLLRGGWVLFLLPIVVVPSTVGIATFVGPTAVTPAGPSADLVALVGVAVVAIAAWIVGGGFVAAWAEAALITAASLGGASLLGGESLGGESLGARQAPSQAVTTRDSPVSTAPSAPSVPYAPVTATLAGRILLARLSGLLPLALAVAWAAPRLGGAAYTELVIPTDPAVPLPLRVLRDLPETLVVVLVAWLVAEAIGGIAARRIVLFDDGVAEAVRAAVAHLLRHPATSLATIGLTLAGPALIVAPGLVVSAAAWDRLGRALRADVDPVAVVVLTLAFVAAWGSGLVLAAAATSWRGVAWTLEVARVDRATATHRRHAGPGTTVQTTVRSVIPRLLHCPRPRRRRA